MWPSLSCCLLVLCTRIGSASTKPNVVFILLDDAGMMDFGSTDPNMRTPNIDQLLQEGLFFNQSYVLPMCAPTRSALLTGRNPHTFGLQDVNSLGANKLNWVNETLSMLSNEMKELGYATHMLGKWHLGHCHPSVAPMGRGFDTFYGMHLGGHSSYTTHFKATTYDWWNNTSIDWTAKDKYSTDLLSNRAVRIIENSKADVPFFVYLAYYAPHGPFEAPEEYKNICSHVTHEPRRIHCGMMAAVDQGVGNIVSALKAKGIYEDTILILMSDNGNPGPANDTGSHSYPLRGGKKSVYEGGTRSYTVLKAPNLDVTGTTWSGMIHAIDWMPTILGMAGGQPKEWMHGINLWDNIRTFQDSNRTSFLYTRDDYWRFNHSAYRLNDWKIIRGKPGFPKGWYPPYNLMEDGTANFEEPRRKAYTYNTIELYNLKEDPYERNDLSETNTDKRNEMIQALDDFLEEYRLQPYQEYPTADKIKESDKSLKSCFCQPPGADPCPTS